MAYSPYAHTTATSGHVGLVRLGTGVGGQADGTLVTTSVPNGVTTGSSPSLASVIITNTTSASSTATGALQVKGGVGIGGSLYAGPIYSNGVLVNTAGVRGYTGTVGGWLGLDGWYVTNTSGSPNPATTEMTFNSTTAATTTVIKLNKLDSNSVDWTNLFNLYTGTSTGYLTLYYTDNDPASSIYYRIDSCTNNSSFFTFNVTYITIGSTAPTGFIPGLSFGVTLSGLKGAQGATGTFSGSTSTQVQFTNATAATSTSTGALTVAGGAGIGGSVFVGNTLTFAASAGVNGIQFNNTTSGSFGLSNLNNSILNDYEVGTFFPVFASSAGAISSVSGTFAGNYVKVGKLVHVSVNITVSALTLGSASGTLYFSQFPFQPAGYAVLTVGGAANWNTNFPTTIELQSNSANGLIYYRPTSNGGPSLLPVSALASNSTINFSGSYVSVF